MSLDSPIKLEEEEGRETNQSKPSQIRFPSSYFASPTSSSSSKKKFSKRKQQQQQIESNEGESMPKIQRTVDLSSGILDQKLKGVIDKLSLGDPDYAYRCISEALRVKRSNLVDLFDQLHFFSKAVAGAANVKAKNGFWTSENYHGHRYISNLIFKSLIEVKESLPVSTVTFMPFTIHDLELYLSNPALNPLQTGATSWREAVVQVISLINSNAKNYRVEIPNLEFAKGGQVDISTTWLNPTHPPPEVAYDLWNKLVVRHITKPIEVMPSQLSAEQWLENVVIERKINDIAHILDQKNMTNEEAVEKTFQSVVDASFFVAFKNAMRIAKQRISSISMLHPDFIPLINDIHFINLTAAYYTNSKISTAATTSYINRTRSSKILATYIDNFKKYFRESSSSSSLPPLLLTTSNLLSSSETFILSENSIY